MTDVLDGRAAVMRATDAEVMENENGRLQLLLDSSATLGALSAHRVRLRNGNIGAGPHTHANSSELFYVLDGTVHLLVGEEVLTATAGDIAVIAPGTAHAFAAAHGDDGELLVVLTPGVDRFEFLRQSARARSGEADLRTFLASQKSYDIHAAESPAWQAARRKK